MTTARRFACLAAFATLGIPCAPAAVHAQEPAAPPARREREPPVTWGVMPLMLPALHAGSAHPEPAPGGVGVGGTF